MENTFRKELEQLVNRHGIDAKLNMPDFIIAHHLCIHLDIMNSLRGKEALTPLEDYIKPKDALS